MIDYKIGDFMPRSCSRHAMITASCLFMLSFPGIAAEVDSTILKLSRADYQDRLEGFWLGQSIANWTGLVTEMDKIGGDGNKGVFYTRDDWGKPDQPSVWGQGIPSNLSPTISWVFENSEGQWGADDDTDIEYLYQHLLTKHQTTRLTPLQIRDGWLQHIYSDENTPFVNADGQKENYLWVSNQRAHDLMREGMLPPETGAAKNNPHFDMIDAQLTTEIFGLFAPGRPDIALDMAELPILTTAREDARWAAEFYIIMYSLAATLEKSTPSPDDILTLAKKARQRLPDASYSAHMFDFVLSQYQADLPWEATRDAVYQRYQVAQKDGYNITSKKLYCNGCFASGINFAASIISLLYGEGDYQNTVKIAVLTGWDSDNPAATWGGMLGFIIGKQGIEAQFNRKFSDVFYIHRTRGGFDNNGIDHFSDMATRGLSIVDQVVTQLNGGHVDKKKNQWHIPLLPRTIAPAVLPDDYSTAHPQN
jgi:hypothetical protein